MLLGDHAHADIHVARAQAVDELESSQKQMYMRGGTEKLNMQRDASAAS